MRSNRGGGSASRRGGDSGASLSICSDDGAASIDYCPHSSTDLAGREAECVTLLLAMGSRGNSGASQAPRAGSTGGGATRSSSSRGMSACAAAAANEGEVAASMTALNSAKSVAGILLSLSGSQNGGSALL